MSSSDYETLDQTGFKLEDTSINYEKTMLRAEFGSGYQATAIIGLPLREWTITIEVLPMLDRYSITHAGGIETRADYLWNFFCRQMDAGCSPFKIRDHKDGRLYLVGFVDLKLTYKVFTRVLYSTGLQLVQRRVQGVESVGAAPPQGVENTDSI